MKLSLCIVGCGRYADVVLNEISNMTEEFDFYFASRDLSKAKSFCERYSGADYFGSYDEALSDPRVQAAYFFTPHHVHLENAQLAARYKKHILVEKPIARTIEESQALVQTAQDAGVQLMADERLRQCRVEGVFLNGHRCRPLAAAPTGIVARRHAPLGAAPRRRKPVYGASSWVWASRSRVASRRASSMARYSDRPAKLRVSASRRSNSR